MSEIFFYKLKNSSSELFLTSLIEKSLDNNWNSVVIFDSTERMEEINDLLWSYKDTSFLPHGSENDENSNLVTENKSSLPNENLNQDNSDLDDEIPF